MQFFETRDNKYTPVHRNDESQQEQAIISEEKDDDMDENHDWLSFLPDSLLQINDWDKFRAHLKKYMAEVDVEIRFLQEVGIFYHDFQSRFSTLDQDSIQQGALLNKLHKIYNDNDYALCKAPEDDETIVRNLSDITDIMVHDTGLNVDSDKKCKAFEARERINEESIADVDKLKILLAPLQEIYAEMADLFKNQVTNFNVEQDDEQKTADLTTTHFQTDNQEDEKTHIQTTPPTQAPTDDGETHDAGTQKCDCFCIVL